MKAKIIVVGGGIIGLASAYYLAKLGGKDIVVIERQYIGSGASTRNASHFRVHFWSKENTLFAIESSKRYRELSRLSGWNPLIEYTGYLWLVSDEKTLKLYEEVNRILWSKLGVGISIFSRKDLQSRYPYLNLDDFIAGVFGVQDGKFHHDFVIYGYLNLLKKLKVKIIEYSEVTNLLMKNGDIIGVKTSNGVIYGDKVLIATNVWSRDLLLNIGIDLPIIAFRKEICVTEPLKPFIDPFIITLNPNYTGLYICQTMRGEVMGSIDYPEIRGKLKPGNTFIWLSKFANKAIKLIPTLKYARYLRIWSGYYDVTPDNSHIMGRSDNWPDGLYVAVGFSGHGFMFAPYVGELIAKYMLFDEIHKHMKPYLPDRFKTNRLINEIMVIG